MITSLLSFESTTISLAQASLMAEDMLEVTICDKEQDEGYTLLHNAINNWQ